MYRRGEGQKLVFGTFNDKRYPKMGVSKSGLILAPGDLQAEINGFLVFRPQRKVLYGEKALFFRGEGKAKNWSLGH